MVNEITLTTEDTEAEEIEKDQYLVFTSKSQEFGIQAMRVHEISAPLGITEIPNTPAHIEGIVTFADGWYRLLTSAKSSGLM